MYQRFLAFFTLKKRCFYTILVKIREVCQIMLANKHCKAINLWYYGNVPKKLGSYNHNKPPKALIKIEGLNPIILLHPDYIYSKKNHLH